MKYVYVLVSSPADFYYEQCLMSLTSLRFYMKEAEVFVLCDQRTANTFSGKRAAIKELAKIISVPFEDTVGNTERSRLIKTAIPDYVQGDFLYIDCDTIICSDLSAIEEFPYEIAGVLDAHVYLDEHLHKQTFVKRDKKLGFHGTAALNGNINGGLVLARDTPYAKEFFKAWNEAWKYSAYKKNDMHDQSALNEANYRTQMKAQLLPGEWNCQPCHGGLAFLKDAKIIHYYSSEMTGKNYQPYYKLADKNLQQRIKDEGKIPQDILEMIKDPKFQFNKVHMLSDKRIISVMQSPLLFTMADLKAHIPFLFNFFEAQASLIRSIGKKIKGKK